MYPRDLEPLIKAIVREVLAEMLGLKASSPDQKRQWHRPADAAKLLDLDTPENLHDLRRAGDLKQGIHWRDTSSRDAGRSTYQYHIGNCRKHFDK